MSEQTLVESEQTQLPGELLYEYTTKFTEVVEYGASAEELISGQMPGLSFMKILCLHAHFDDFEFVASGTFELWRRKLGDGLRAKVIVCTDGKAGHHFRTREETGKVRLEEQRASARLGYQSPAYSVRLAPYLWRAAFSLMRPAAHVATR